MSKKPLEVSDAEFQKEVLDSDVPVLVDFWAPWCGPCRAVAPILEELASEYDGTALIAKVNTDENQDRAMQLGIRGIPTMILFVGGREVERIVGVRPKDALKQVLDRAAGASV